MNWKDVPNLFANGKFKAQINWKNGSKSIKEINGYFNSYPFEDDFLDSKDYLQAFDLGDTALPLEICTLIARKIEDMSDDEFLSCAKLMNEPINRETAKSFQDFIKEEGWLPSNIFIYLLSIGVYPFEWDETVIDIKTL